MLLVRVRSPTMFLKVLVTDQISLKYIIVSFKCYYTNAQSILNKFDEFLDRVNQVKPLIICITESWLNVEVKTQRLI